jgi:hypothetical protein
MICKFCNKNFDLEYFLKNKKNMYSTFCVFCIDKKIKEISENKKISSKL